MKNEEIIKIKKNPLKEIKKRFSKLIKEDINSKDFIAVVDSYVVNGGHRVKIIGNSKNFTFEIEIRESVN